MERRKVAKSLGVEGGGGGELSTNRWNNAAAATRRATGYPRIKVQQSGQTDSRRWADTERALGRMESAVPSIRAARVGAPDSRTSERCYLLLLRDLGLAEMEGIAPAVTPSRS
jgi:hypothetical protein